MAEQTGALARVQYEADGSTRIYSIPFPYISRDDIKVSVDGQQVDFVFLDGSTVRLDAAPETGLIIDIVRETEKEHLLVEFNDGSTLLETDLTLAAQQSFFIAQEAFDQTGGTMAVANDGSYSASTRRISLLGYPRYEEDAATKGYVDNIFAQGHDAYEQAQIATSAADTAVSARDTAQAAESASLNYRNTANQHRIAAAESASEAHQSELNAASSASAAKASEDDVAANAQAAQDAEDSAKTYRDTAVNAAGQAQSYAQSANSSATSANNDAALANTRANNAATSESNAQMYRDQAEGYKDSANQSALSASSDASAAETSASNAADSEQNAADSASEAAGYAAGLNLPSATGNGSKILRQKEDESGFEYVDAPYSKSEVDGFVMKVVTHGTDPDVSRPTADCVYWKGSVAPNNSLDGDLWYDTTGEIV